MASIAQLTCKNPYFVNDIVCRVRKNSDAEGTVVDIGTVDFPFDSHNGQEVAKPLEKILQDGCGETFWVTWGHRSSDPNIHRKVVKELLHANDKDIFLLDRQITHGMYVKKRNDDQSIGIVRAVDTFVSVKTQSGNVVNDIDAKTLQFNWMTEKVLGSYVISNGWVGQIVQINKSAKLAIEVESEFVLSWTEQLGESEYQRDKCLTPQDWPNVGIHNRFDAVGDQISLSKRELSQAKWVSAPKDKNWTWPIFRPFEYSDKFATVQSIESQHVRIKWLERIMTSPDKSISPPPREDMGLDEINYLIERNIFQMYVCIVPENKTVGDSVCVGNDAASILQATTYDRWVNTYLQEMKIRSQIFEPKNQEPSVKRPKVSHYDPKMDSGLGSFYSSITQDAAAVIDLSKQNVRPGILIARRSRVAIQFSPQHIESLPSTEVVPIFLDESLRYAPGSIVKLSKPPTINVQDWKYYGIVVSTDVSKVPAERKIAVNFYQISAETSVPTLDSLKILSHTEIEPHPVYTMSPGDLLIRSNLFEDFSLGIFIRALVTGELLVDASQGRTIKVLPNRVMIFKKKAFSVHPNDVDFEDLLCSSPYHLPWTVDWKIGLDFGKPINQLIKSIELKNPNPSSSILTHWSRDNFASNENTIQFFQGTIEQHYFGRQYPDNPAEDILNKIIQDNINALNIDFKLDKVWLKVMFGRKDLIFAAMDGPFDTLYEDVLFFFDIKIFPLEEALSPATIYFNSFFEYDIIPDTDPIDEESEAIRFSSKNEIPPVTFLKRHAPIAGRRQCIFHFFQQVKQKNMKVEPLPMQKSFGERLVDIISISSTDEIQFENKAFALNEITRYVIRQIINPPIAWKQELFSYYRIHLPKFCLRIIRWVIANGNFELKDNILGNLQDLMFAYNKLF